MVPADLEKIPIQCDCICCGARFMSMSRDRDAQLCGLCKTVMRKQTAGEAAERINTRLGVHPAVKD